MDFKCVLFILVALDVVHSTTEPFTDTFQPIMKMKTSQPAVVHSSEPSDLGFTETINIDSPAPQPTVPAGTISPGSNDPKTTSPSRNRGQSRPNKDDEKWKVPVIVSCCVAALLILGGGGYYWWNKKQLSHSLSSKKEVEIAKTNLMTDIHPNETHSNVNVGEENQSLAIEIEDTGRTQ